MTEGYWASMNSLTAGTENIFREAVKLRFLFFCFEFCDFWIWLVHKIDLLLEKTRPAANRFWQSVYVLIFILILWG
jgi:hypothetical protein